MSAFAPTLPGNRLSYPNVLMAALEVLAYLVVVAGAILAFLLGWLTPNEAVVLAVMLLGSLLVLAWIRFHQGRHPCFLFLGVLILLQGGKLLAYCAGGEIRPLTISVVAPFPFDLTRDESGIVLLCLALSAICIYAPCRWNYQYRLAPPDTRPTRRYLPYLYFLFFATLPAQLFKNYEYYEYLREHGGYLHFWLNHGDVASSVPFFVRATVLISYPVFVAIFVFESRKKYLYLATILYFVAASLVLLQGLRGGIFALILALWYAAAVKTTKRRRILTILALAFALVLVAGVVETLREDSDAMATYAFAPLEIVRLQGNSLDVTEVAVKYRDAFAPYMASYLWNELQDAFVARDVRDYAPGRRFSYDVTVLLNPTAFSAGMGTAGSYLAEAYLIGELTGVVIISLLIGSGLHLLHRLSRNALSLLIVTLILPPVLLMPRGQLLDWLSELLRMAILLGVLAVGWILYRFITELGEEFSAKRGIT